jgi:hypothetical protein
MVAEAGVVDTVRVEEIRAASRKDLLTEVRRSFHSQIASGTSPEGRSW